MSAKKKALAIVNTFNAEAKETAALVVDFLRARGVDCGAHYVERGFDAPNGAAEDAAFKLLEDCSFAVTLGGDGTVLHTARRCAVLGVPVFPINLGRFGFIAGVQKDAWRQGLDSYLAGNAEVSKRMLLSVRVARGGEDVFSAIALNDAVVAGGGVARIVNLRLEVNDTLVCGYRADGVIVATPTGSTAYSAAAGGPIVDPEMNAFIINPVCAFSLSSRPLVVPADDTVAVSVVSGQRTELTLTIDGQESFALEEGDRARIVRGEYSLSLINCHKQIFYAALRSKLALSGGLNREESGDA